MSRNFFVQGFSDSTYAEQVRWVLSTPNLEQAIISVAFINADGVNLLEENLDQIIDRTAFFCGIRNDITSYQGILRLFEKGHQVYLVDTGSRSRIFHPKVYLAKGANISRVVIGSGNLTIGGLNNNIEAGIGLELDMTKDVDKDFISQLQSQFNVLPENYPENVLLVTSIEQLELLRDGGKLLDEAETSPPRPATASNPNIPDTVPRINLPINLVSATIKRSTRQRQRAQRQNIQTLPNQVVTVPSVPTSLLRVWQSKPLTERDLNIPSGEQTHSTGSINLDKGMLDEHIDHRHYFRDEVFNNLDWAPRSGSGQVEEAEAKFQLIIKNQNLGEFSLNIRNSTDRTSATYLQRNAMTRLSWGDMRSYIAKPDYIGRTMSLYADEADSTRFVVEID